MVRSRNQRLRRPLRRLPNHVARADRDVPELEGADAPPPVPAGQRHRPRLGAVAWTRRGGKIRPGAVHPTYNLVRMAADQRVTLIVVEGEPVRQPPRLVLLQVQQRLAVGRAAEPADRQVVLLPAERGPRAVVQVRDWRSGARVEVARGRGRGEFDRRQAGIADSSRRRPPDCLAVKADLVERLQRTGAVPWSTRAMSRCSALNCSPLDSASAMAAPAPACAGGRAPRTVSCRTRGLEVRVRGDRGAQGSGWTGREPSRHSRLLRRHRRGGEPSSRAGRARGQA